MLTFFSLNDFIHRLANKHVEFIGLLLQAVQRHSKFLIRLFLLSSQLTKLCLKINIKFLPQGQVYFAYMSVFATKFLSLIPCSL